MYLTRIGDKVVNLEHMLYAQREADGSVTIAFDVVKPDGTLATYRAAAGTEAAAALKVVLAPVNLRDTDIK